ncbi:hypothetical protein BBP40_007307 [Aspergillus hancockii]|nr:hypothetical protein BBP40_007307 [Aspergillus hancockii]
MKVRQQRIHNIELESRINIEVSPRRLGLNGSFRLLVGHKRFQSSHGRGPNGNNAAPLRSGRIDSRSGLVANPEIPRSHLVIFNLSFADMVNRVSLGRPDMQRDTRDLNTFGVNLS